MITEVVFFCLNIRFSVNMNNFSVQHNRFFLLCQLCYGKLHRLFVSEIKRPLLVESGRNLPERMSVRTFIKKDS